MATVGTKMNLAERLKRLDPDGKEARIIELQLQRDDLIHDLLWQEANGVAGHQVTVRTGYGASTWKKLNVGTAPVRNSTAQITEAIAILENWMEIEKEVAEVGGNVAAALMNEFDGHRESLTQEWIDTYFHGSSSTSPEEITGLLPRYNALTGEISQNVISAGGSDSDNTSLWVVNHCKDLYCIFPKGGSPVVDVSEPKLETKETSSDRLQYVYRARSQLKPGLCVADWRNVVRVCNIDVSTLVANSTPADLSVLVRRALERIPNIEPGCRIYCNRTVHSMWSVQERDAVKAGGGLTYENVDGRMKRFFDGIQIRIVDKITNAETAVS